MQKVYEPGIRALLGTASRFCEAVVLELGTVPNDATLGLRILQVVRRGAHATYNQFEEGKTVHRAVARRPLHLRVLLEQMDKVTKSVIVQEDRGRT